MLKFSRLIFASILETDISLLAGKFVGMITHRGKVDSEQEHMFQFTVTPRQSARLLQEANLSPGLIILAEVAFIRITLAWITGIILLIATILGVITLLTHAIYYLFSSFMPLCLQNILFSL